jgi:hypothetical protein
MVPYIFLLVTTTLFAYFADELFKKHRSQSIFFIIAIVISYTIFAGSRDFGIGIDTNLYIEEYFNTAKSLNSVKDFFLIESMDKGFLFLCWLSSLINSDKQIALFVIELWIISFTLHAVYILKKYYGVKLWVFVFLYFFIFFGYSLNLMRQFCAMSLLLWGFSWLRQGNWKVYLFTQFLAFYFHSSSIVFLLVPLVYYLSFIKTIRIRNYITIASFSLLILFITSFSFFLILFDKLSIISSLYLERYGKNSDFIATAGSSYLLLISYMIEIYLLYLACNNKRISVSFKYILVTLFTITFILSQLRFITNYLDRLSYYINLVYIVYLSCVLDDKRISQFVRISLVFLIIFFSYRIFILNKGAEIYPYRSKILGI